MLRWGSRLCVSSQEAEDLCRAVWNVPAECRDITFDPEGGARRKRMEKDSINTKVWGFQSRVESFQDLHKSKTSGTQNVQHVP